MTVTRIHEDPRVTKPYTDEQWQRDSRNWATSIERELAAGDVRLTMGGEPTFVSIDDMDGEEWNTAALGPNKQPLAGDLLVRLRDKFATGRAAALRTGQVVSGRIAAALGVHLLLAHRWTAAVERSHSGWPIPIATTASAQGQPSASPRNCRAVSTLDPEYVIAAYEDPLDVYPQGTAASRQRRSR